VKPLRSRMLWGLLAIAMGVLFLLENLRVLPVGGAWSVVFFVAAAAFASVYIDDRNAWWAIIPAMTMFGLGALIAISGYLTPAYPEWGAGVFLGSLALAFWIIYFATRRTQWWAIIPGGVLLALASALILEPFVGGEGFVAIFMLGMGFTFALLYLLPTPDGRMVWALIPAAVLGLIGIAFALAASELAASAINLIWPLALILIGGYLLLRSLRQS
jgi:hypothetical protein